MVIISKQQREDVLKNAAPDWQHPDRPLVITGGGWSKLDPEAVVAALEHAVPDADRHARDILDRMGRQQWSMRATKYARGEKHAQRKTNHAPSITLSMGGKQYSLECRAYPQLHLVGVAA